MNKIILTITAIFNCSILLGQFVATVELTKPIEGICNDKEIYVLFSMLNEQEEAICPISEQEIFEKLNNEVEFLKMDSKHKDKGVVELFINCKGEIVQCNIDNKTKNEELDRQIEKVFNTLGDWQPGKLHGQEVDSSRLFNFKIKKGKIIPD